MAWVPAPALCIVRHIVHSRIQYSRVSGIFANLPLSAGLAGLLARQRPARPSIQETEQKPQQNLDAAEQITKLSLPPTAKSAANTRSLWGFPCPTFSHRPTRSCSMSIRH